MTSFAVVAKVRRLAGTRRVGHLGTLDPMAEGVLPLALGRATRLIEYVGGDKAYRAEITLGVTTTTLDAEGDVVERRPVPHLGADAVDAALAAVAACGEQIPPMASALHHEGRRLYALFREGKTVEIAPRPVRIDRLQRVAIDLPHLVIEVECGPGTYIRSIARDVGERLGCGGHLSALLRTAKGPFRLEGAVDLERLEADGVEPWLLPPRVGVDAIAWRTIDSASELAVRCGKRIALQGDENETVCALADAQGTLIAIARLHAGEAQPLKVFPPFSDPHPPAPSSPPPQRGHQVG